MSFVSTAAKLNKGTRKLGHQCVAPSSIRRNHTNFSGTTVPPLTKERWNKAMAMSHKYKNMSAW